MSKKHLHNNRLLLCKINNCFICVVFEARQTSTAVTALVIASVDCSIAINLRRTTEEIFTEYKTRVVSKYRGTFCVEGYEVLQFL